jgi:hypothetical protein
MIIDGLALRKKALAELTSAPAGTTETIGVSGKIESSLYAALEKALDANAAQRITWLLQNRGVPLTALPKGAAFNIQIARRTDARLWRD